jgi:hypothetical protein
VALRAEHLEASFSVEILAAISLRSRNPNPVSPRNPSSSRFQDSLDSRSSSRRIRTPRKIHRCLESQGNLEYLEIRMRRGSRLIHRNHLRHNRLPHNHRRRSLRCNFRPG